MRRSLLTNSLLRTLLASSLLAVASPAQAASIGINFVDEWGGDGGAEVTQEAFGIPAANWFNMPRVFNSNGGGGVASNATINLPGGGTLLVEWSCVNTYSLTGDAPVDGPGDEQVVYGYLDDTGVGYQVRLSGFRNSMANYSISLVASTDGGEGFTDAQVVHGDFTNTLQYVDILNPSLGGIYSISSASGDISTLADNTAVITGLPRNGGLRSTVAGILLTYTLGGSNPPLMETQPQAPAGAVYEGQPLTISALASGSPTLAYQWRQNGNLIANATNAVYVKSAATTADSGSYDVVVTNPFGTVTSAAVTVTISALVQPAITQSPLSQTLYVGYPATFTVAATGGQLGYQWQRGTQPIVGATNATLTLPSITLNDAETYSVTVSNSVGSTSASASLGVKIPTPGTYEAEMVQLKPALYFRMSETGPIMQDTATNSGSLGSAGTGLYVGTLTHGVQGALVGNSDAAVSLNGGKVSVPHSASLNPSGSFTAECWAKPSDTGSGNRVLVQSMINGQYADNASDRSGWVLRQNGVNLEFVIGGDNGSPFYTTVVTAQGVLTAGVWNYCAAVYRSDSLNVALLVNGVEVTNVTAAAPVLPNTAAPLIVGDRGYGGWTFKGSIDEVAIYPTALATSRLLAHYTAGSNAGTSSTYPSLVTADGAVEYLRLDDPGLSPSANATANSGTLGAAWTGTYVDGGSTLGTPLIAKGTAGPRPSSFPGFSSTNTAVAMTNGWVTSPVLTIGNHVTVTCWMNHEAVATTGDLGWPAWLGGGGMHLNNGTANVPEAELRYHWNGGNWDWASGLLVPADVWTFVAMVVEPDKATFYMSEGTSLLSATNTVTHAPMVVTSPPGFGGNQPARADRNYIGQLDETAVFDRALTPTEITALFERSLGLGPVPPSAITITKVGADYYLNWTGGALQSAPAISASFTDVPNATSPYKLSTTAAQMYYRVRGK